MHVGMADRNDIDNSHAGEKKQSGDDLMEHSFFTKQTEQQRRENFTNECLV